MGEVVSFPEFVRVSRRVLPVRRTLQPATWRDRAVEAAWLAIGLPLSMGIFALQILPFVLR